MISGETDAMLTLIYIIPCYTVYCIFAGVLFSTNTKEFNTPFYKLLKLLAIVDLLLIPMFFVNNRLTQIRSFFLIFDQLKNPTWFISIWFYVCCVFQHSQFYIHVLIAFNRFSAIILIGKYGLIWSKFWFRAMGLGVFFVPGFYLSWLLVAGSMFRPISFPGYEAYVVDNIFLGPQIFRKSTCLVIVAVFTCLVKGFMDMFTVAFLYRRRHRLHLNKSQLDNDLRLFAVSIVLLIFHLFYTTIVVLGFLYGRKDIPWTATVYLPAESIALDLTSLISPFCILILNPKLRQLFLTKLGCHRYRRSSISSSKVNQISTIIIL